MRENLEVSWPREIPVLEGEHCKLKLWTVDEVQARVEASGDPEILRFTTHPSDPSESGAINWIEQKTRESAQGINAFFAIVHQGVAVGSVGLITIDLHQANAELGYWLLPQGRGRGLATEGVKLIRDWSLSLGFKRIYMTTNLDNIASQKVARKTGFQAEGILRSYGYIRDGTREDVVLFGLVALGAEASR